MSSDNMLRQIAMKMTMSGYEGISAGRIFSPPTFKKNTLIGYEYGFLGVVKNIFCMSESTAAENIFDHPEIPTPVSLTSDSARQATLDFGDKYCQMELSHVVRCRQLTSLKNIGSFHAFSTGR